MANAGISGSDVRDVMLEAVWRYEPRPEKLAAGSVEAYDVETFEVFRERRRTKDFFRGKLGHFV